jgi:hypothetical protein
MDRYWFFTWRTYGTWLPGEDGFVGYYHTFDGRRLTSNQPGAPKAEPIPQLARYARNLLRGEPVGLTLVQAHAVADQLREHAGFKGRVIDAIAMSTTSTWCSEPPVILTRTGCWPTGRRTQAGR